MQIVIKIDEKLYNYMQTEEYDKHLDKRFDYQIRFAVKNGIPISKETTNGNMIKIMFPGCKDWKVKIEDNDGEVYEVHFVQLPNSMTINKYAESWWNAPYEIESEE
jgi:hypothetical protein